MPHQSRNRSARKKEARTHGLHASYLVLLSLDVDPMDDPDDDEAGPESLLFALTSPFSAS